VSLPTEHLTWIVGASGKADKDILRMFKSVAEVVNRLGACIVLVTSDGDSTFLGKLQALFSALTGGEGQACLLDKDRYVLLDGALPLHAQHAVAARVGGVPWLIDQHHSSKDVRYTMTVPGEITPFPMVTGGRGRIGSPPVGCIHRCLA
jgi:hypothetical protein